MASEPQTIAALAAARRPDLVTALVAVGMDIDAQAADKNAYQFALEAAHARNNRKAIRQLEAIGPRRARACPNR